MTQEERKACARLYYLFSEGETIPEHQWNDQAAYELYAMILSVNHCSKGIAWLPLIPSTMPTTAAQAGTYIVKYFVHAFQMQDALNKSETAVVMPCLHSHFLAHRSLIQMAAAGISQ